MLHFLCSLLGMLILYYELTFVGLRVLFQYSGWFLTFTTITHLFQIIVNVPSFIAYVIVVIGITIVFPASIPSLVTFENNFTSYLLYDLGNHVFLPLCTIFHLNNTVYSSINESILFLLFYNIVWITIVELFAFPKPYDILENITIEYRILFYVTGCLVGILGLLIFSILPCISKREIIKV